MNNKDNKRRKVSEESTKLVTEASQGEISRNKEKPNNQIYCCFANDANTLLETLKVSFSDYLALKENKESLANTRKES